MISIIICSRQKKISPELDKNIRQNTRGEYEIISIDNSQNSYSIFQAYNIGINKSKFPYLVFLHEDIFFHTSGWDQLVLKHFLKNPASGLLGIAGSTQKSLVPSAWWDHPKDKLFLNILQHYPDGSVSEDIKGFKNNKESHEVVIIDGVFMALRKSTGAFFNEDIKGFHNYDQNISLEVRKKGFQVWVTNEILIEHFSSGYLNDAWFNSSIVLSRIYKNTLPQFINSYSKNDRVYTLLRFIEKCNKNKKYELGFKYWLEYFHNKPFDSGNCFFLKYYLLRFKDFILRNN